MAPSCVQDARERYGIDAPLAVGYSNGANIAAALLMMNPRALSGAILLHAMVPLTDPPEANLDGKPVLILSGRQDPIVPADNADALASMLSRTGAKVDHRILPVGHQLSQADVALTGRWLAEATQHTTAFHDRLRHDERRP
jgi:phospholipase/carboxylesterase